MAFRETNFLVTLVFGENTDIRKQINTEHAFKNEIIKDLQHLVIGREIKHFVVADDEVINEKLKKQEPPVTPTRKVGKWIDGWALDASDEFEPIIRCPFCGYETAAYAWTEYDCCPKCGAYLKGEEDGNA